MTRWHRAAPAAALVLLLAACAGGGDDVVAADPVALAGGDVAEGEELYARNCVACHGVEGGGTASGPPFVHEVYVPSHHGDESFRSAVRNGVMAHHWEFGPMPPVQGLDDQDIADIVAYVRAVQREAGLID